MNEVVLSNDKLISTSRAAELTGYARDYLGQLCRNEALRCRMIGKQWFVDVDSLHAYAPKMKKPRASDFDAPQEGDSLTSSKNDRKVPKIEDVRTGTFVLDDDEYIPTQKAAKIFGYTQDYIGQLARSGDIPAKKIGRRWFVAKNALSEYQNNKDAMLQAVQANSVQIDKRQKESQSEEEKLANIHFSMEYYRDDGSPLLPVAGVIHHKQLPEKKQNTHSVRFENILKNKENTKIGKPRLAQPSLSREHVFGKSANFSTSNMNMKMRRVSGSSTRHVPTDRRFVTGISGGDIPADKTSPLLVLSSMILFFASFTLFLLVVNARFSFVSFDNTPMSTYLNSVNSLISSFSPVKTLLYHR